MEDDPRQQIESLLPYERWIANALRHVVVQAIEHVAKHGLPGAHHFYISFRTTYPGVVIPARLRAQYPEEMTIVLQHQFWDLKLDHEARAITVGLSFGGIPSTLLIPLDALVSFADPHIRYALRFDPIEPEPKTTFLTPVPNEPDPEQEHEQEPGVEAAETPAPTVVSLDAFRRRTPAGRTNLVGTEAAPTEPPETASPETDPSEPETAGTEPFGSKTLGGGLPGILPRRIGPAGPGPVRIEPAETHPNGTPPKGTPPKGTPPRGTPSETRPDGSHPLGTKPPRPDPTD